MLRARILAPFKAHTKVAAFGRHHKRGAAAFGRATSFVVSFVCALNGASILALSTIYDLRLSKTGRTVVGRTFDWVDGRSDGDEVQLDWQQTDMLGIILTGGRVTMDRMAAVELKEMWGNCRPRTCLSCDSGKAEDVAHVFWRCLA